jgi:hypothetical protein
VVILALFMLVVVNTFFLFEDLLVHVVAVEILDHFVDSGAYDLLAPGQARTEVLVHFFK